MTRKAAKLHSDWLAPKTLQSIRNLVKLKLSKHLIERYVPLQFSFLTLFHWQIKATDSGVYRFLFTWNSSNLISIYFACSIFLEKGKNWITTIIQYFAISEQYFPNVRNVSYERVYSVKLKSILFSSAIILTLHVFNLHANFWVEI